MGNKRRDQNEETPKDEGRGEQTVMGRTCSGMSEERLAKIAQKTEGVVGEEEDQY